MRRRRVHRDRVRVTVVCHGAWCGVYKCVPQRLPLNMRSCRWRRRAPRSPHPMPRRHPLVSTTTHRRVAHEAHVLSFTTCGHPGGCPPVCACASDANTQHAHDAVSMVWLGYCTSIPYYSAIHARNSLIESKHIEYVHVGVYSVE